MYSNRYIFIYATIMVIVVAVLLSVVATVLKPFQDANVKTEKICNILSSINIESGKKEAVDNYKKYITEELLIKNDGSSQPGDAFNVVMKLALKEDMSTREMPLFVAKTPDNKTRYIVPLWGRGLWGSIWGYISFDDDFNTVYGSIFDHKSETPGLGAEIATKKFQDQFKGKSIFDDQQEFVSVRVVKGGAPDGDNHAVDAISGGTITSNGVNLMLNENIGFYKNYFIKAKNTLNNE